MSVKIKYVPSSDVTIDVKVLRPAWREFLAY